MPHIVAKVTAENSTATAIATAKSWFIAGKKTSGMSASQGPSAKMMNSTQKVRWWVSRCQMSLC